jgi:hypothetical protein
LQLRQPSLAISQAEPAGGEFSCLASLVLLAPREIGLVGEKAAEGRPTMAQALASPPKITGFSRIPDEIAEGTFSRIYTLSMYEVFTESQKL